jgi:hypothetical protein
VVQRLFRRCSRCGSETARRLLSSSEIFGLDRPARWATAA